MLNAPALCDLRHEMSGVGDDKIRRIVAWMDMQAIPEAAQAILDQLRPRLAVLRPPRALRFPRLLFLPLDPVIVSAHVWRPGDPSLPRSVLVPVARVVHAALGQEAAEIDRLIAHRDTADDAVIATAGAWLWARAGAILAELPAPPGWDATGLPPTIFPPLARAIAAVLRRAARLRDAARDAAVGVVGTSDDIVRGILAGLAAESSEGFGMVVACLLALLPHATPQLQRLIASNRGTADSARLRQAMDRGVDDMLSRMEDAKGFDAEILRAQPRGAGQEVRRIGALLRDIDSEPDVARHRPRLKSIRLKLDQACRTCFGEALIEGFVTPLTAAAAPLTAMQQTRIEGQIRDLRALETAARKIGGATVYDALLEQAATTARSAAATGVLTPVRHMRLVEILAGPEAAEALYPRV
jgi:hypothetical protein